jgi:hypothetical protein
VFVTTCHSCWVGSAHWGVTELMVVTLLATHPPIHIFLLHVAIRLQSQHSLSMNLGQLLCCYSACHRPLTDYSRI